MTDLTLAACTPDPLLSYLKAVGILRLVGTQADPGSRGWWEGGVFHLRSRLEMGDLERFFLDQYWPSPIVSPWNGGSGFFPRDRRTGFDAIDNSTSPRLEPYRVAINAARAILRRVGCNQKPGPREKARLLAACRSNLPDACLPWLDAAVALGDRPKWAPLLGTGGNDGRLEFSNNFMERLRDVLTDLGADRHRSTAWLRSGLVDPSPVPLVEAAVGAFHPGGIGGPNATQGFDGKFIVNPWEYVLALEGVLLFASGTARRLSAGATGATAFPFTVQSVSVGYTTEAGNEDQPRRARGELWVPLWSRPASLREIRHLMAEGRAQWGRRQSRTGVDFARAAATLGVDRGVTTFRRYAFLLRSGRSYLGVPLGDVPVSRSPQVGLLHEVDGWIERLRRAVRGEAPAGWSKILRDIDRGMVDFSTRGEPTRLQRVLIALGEAERVVASTQGKVRGMPFMPPMNRLSSRWAEACDDRSPEYRLAAAVAAVGSGGEFPLRAMISPVTARGSWAADQPSLSMARIADVAAVLLKRCVRAAQRSTGTVWVTASPLGAPRAVPWDAIGAFVEGRLDEPRFLGLVRGLVLVHWAQGPILSRIESEPPLIDYAVLKLGSGTVPLVTRSGDRITLAPDMAIVRCLLRGDVAEALARAARRLRTHGLVPLACEALERGERLASDSARGLRLAAALLVPVSTVRDLYKRVIDTQVTTAG